MLNFVTMLLLVVIFFSCSSSTVMKTPPATDDGYTLLPFKKVINPAFAEEGANKWIRCKVKFMNINTVVMDLPAKYRKDFVRIMVTDPNDMTSISMRVVIPKSKSDLVFELKMQDTIELFAYLVPITSTSAVSGRSQSNILFEVAKLRKIE